MVTSPLKVMLVDQEASIGDKKLMTLLCHSLRKHIFNLEVSRNMRKGNGMTVQYFPNRLTVHLNVFGTLIKDEIGSNLNGTTVVSMERSSLRQNTTNLSKETTKPENLRTSSRNCTIFGFNLRFGDAILFLTLPRYQRVTKKHAPTCYRSSRIKASCLICITVRHKPKRSPTGKE